LPQASLSSARLERAERLPRTEDRLTHRRDAGQSGARLLCGRASPTLHTAAQHGFFPVDLEPKPSARAASLDSKWRERQT